MWEYDTEEHTWTCRSSGAGGGGPAPRGGCQVALHGSVLFVFGGHTAWREGKQEMEKVHDDVWALDLHTWQVICACAADFWESSFAASACTYPTRFVANDVLLILARSVTCVCQSTP